MAHGVLVTSWVRVRVWAPRHGVAGCRLQAAGGGAQAEGAHEVDADMTTTATKVDMAPWKTAEPV